MRQQATGIQDCGLVGVTSIIYRFVLVKETDWRLQHAIGVRPTSENVAVRQRLGELGRVLVRSAAVALLLGCRVAVKALVRYNKSTTDDMPRMPRGMLPLSHPLAVSVLIKPAAPIYRPGKDLVFPGSHRQ